MSATEAGAAAAGVLERYGFDSARFERLRQSVANGTLTAAGNVVSGVVEPPQEDDLVQLPGRHEPDFEAAREAGIDAIRAGRVASVVLAGGMATRFGGLVKGLVEAVQGRSFLDLKLRETERLARELDADIPVALMTSFATDDATRAAVRRLEWPEPLVFAQSVALRLRPDGELFRDASGSVSLYAPGHGDLLEAIRGSGILAELRERGVRHLTISNVDNLGARVDPVVVGAHLLAGRPLTVELAAREQDTGGVPVRLDGRPVLLEGPRFPPGFDHERVSVFNTNTAMVDVEALERSYELTWLYVEKEVDGEPVVQLERLYHELAAFLPTTFLQVPRKGPRGRFFPVKVPDDLDRCRGDLEVMLAASVL